MPCRGLFYSKRFLLGLQHLKIVKIGQIGRKSNKDIKKNIRILKKFCVSVFLCKILHWIGFWPLYLSKPDTPGGIDHKLHKYIDAAQQIKQK